MTVGEPEINLNTWGLKYVKKSRDPFKDDTKNPIAGSTKPSESITSQDIGSDMSKEELSTSTFPDRKEDSKGDTDVIVQDTQKPKEQKEQIHVAEQTRGNPTGSEFGRRNQVVSGGKEKPKEGATHGDKKTQTLDRQGKLSRSGSPASGSGASHDSGIRSPHADKKRDEQGNPVKFKKPKEGTGGAARDIKRSMDMVILKCKTLKIKNQLAELQDSKPHYTPEEVNEATYSNRGRNTRDSGITDMPSPNKPKKDENPATHDENTKYYNDDGSLIGAGEKARKEFEDKHKSDEIVAKAIELINEAYDQIGKGKNVEETQDKYRDEFDLIDQDNPQEEVDEEEFNSLGYQKELKERENSKKGDSAVTTSTEGTNNPVNAGKKESFGKTLDTQGRKDEYTKEEHAEHDSQKD